LFCTKCGNRLEDGQAFCTKCGTRVGAPANPYQAYLPSDETISMDLPRISVRRKYASSQESLPGGLARLLVTNRRILLVSESHWVKYKVLLDLIHDPQFAKETMTGYKKRLIDRAEERQSHPGSRLSLEALRDPANQFVLYFLIKIWPSKPPLGRQHLEFRTYVFVPQKLFRGALEVVRWMDPVSALRGGRVNVNEYTADVPEDLSVQLSGMLGGSADRLMAYCGSKEFMADYESES
jgi:hypothetical protein